jgi:hypothetical protein
MGLERYSSLWTKPFYYVLGPLPEYKQTLAEKGVRYYPHRWMGIGYVPGTTIDEYIPEIVKNMLEAGVPIIDPLPDETQEEALAHFWTDRLHDFALIQTSPGSTIAYNIYRLDPPEMLIIPITYSRYQDIIDRMLAAGATILPKVPEPPK